MKGKSAFALAVGVTGFVIGLGGSVAQAVVPPDERAEPTLLLALKHVVYRDPAGRLPMDAKQAGALIDSVNTIYGVCRIRFVLESFVATDPGRDGMRFQPTQMRELGTIRRRYGEPDRMLVVTTGPWAREGGLGKDGENAWTTLPGDQPSGSVIEGTYARHVGLLAHELGHALNLEHRPERSNLMNTMIYQDSRGIDPSQCQRMRAAALTWKTAALRNEGIQPARELAGRASGDPSPSRRALALEAQR